MCELSQPYRTPVGSPRSAGFLQWKGVGINHSALGSLLSVCLCFMQDCCTPGQAELYTKKSRQKNLNLIFLLKRTKWFANTSTASLFYQPCLAVQGYRNHLLWLLIPIQWKQSRFYLLQIRGYVWFFLNTKQTSVLVCLTM